MRKLLLNSAALLAAAVVWSAGANAAAIIDNGTIQLGVDDFGQLNVPGGVPSPVTGTTTVGLRFLPTGNESTSHGCLCEGWGVGIGGGGGSGSANNNFGAPVGLSLVSFVSGASTATSVVDMGGKLKVTHDFAPSTSANLYSVKVSIENTSGVDIADLRYTRTFDWDIEPTTFSDVVTIGGSAAATAVLLAIDNGFVNSDPFAARPTLLGGTGDFVDEGPADIGANFDFGFGALKAGETFEFEIFYGAAGTEAGILAALGSVSAEVYSLGQSNCDAAGTGASCSGRPSNTFAFGFKGVGGKPISPVPLPGAAILLMTGLGAMGAFGARRRKAAA